MSYTLTNSRPSLRRFSLWSRLSVIVTIQLCHILRKSYFSRVCNIIMVTCMTFEITAHNALSVILVTLCGRTCLVDLLCSAALHTGKANLCTSVPTGCTMLLVLSEEHKTHLGFLMQVDVEGMHIKDFGVGGYNYPIPQL